LHIVTQACQPKRAAINARRHLRNVINIKATTRRAPITLSIFFSLLVIFPLWSTPLAGGASVLAQAQTTDFKELERTVEEELKETKTPGAAVAVINQGRVVFIKGFGVANVETGAAVTPEMLFRLGSTTKMFTGAAALVLAEQGKLKLDAPVGSFAKGLPPRLAQVTPHQLLSNTGGVADFAAPFISHDDSALAVMVRSWKDDVLFAEPGKIYSYSSPGFWLSGYVIEEAGQKAYADMMEELLFRPLGMARTTLRPLVAMTYPLSMGHSVQGENKTAVVIRPAFNNVAQWPAGSIYSSAAELSRFVMALLSGGRLEGKQVLPPSLFAKLSGKYAQMPGAPEVAYGYGLLNFEDRGVRLISHGGFSRGYGSMIQMVPEHNFAVIVVTNRSGETLRRTTEKAKELLLPLKPAEAEKPRKPLPLAPSDVARFSGRYVNATQVWEIYAKNDQLFLKYMDTEYALTKTGEDRLSYGDQLENELVLVTGTAGRADYLFTGLYSAKRN
jgi:CubicO group peptidase (beta-lactamase class C family)